MNFWLVPKLVKLSLIEISIKSRSLRVDGGDAMNEFEYSQ